MKIVRCTIVFILESTAKVISDHRPIYVVSQAGIEPGTLWFQDNHVAQYATEVTHPTLMPVNK